MSTQSVYEQAQHIVGQIDSSGGAQPGETTRELCLAIDPGVSREVVEIVDRHRNSDGSFRAVVNPADKAAKARAIHSLSEKR